MDDTTIYFNESDASIFVENVTTTISPTSVELSLFQTHYYSASVLHFGAVMCAINAILGIFGNFVTIAALAFSPNLRNATTAFVINLCLADGLFCIIGPPLTVTTFLNRTWVHPEIWCSFKVFAQFTNASVSVFTMAAIAINRYVLIAHPQIYPKVYTQKTMIVKLALLWMVPLAMWLPALFGKRGQFGFGKSEGICTHLPNETGNPKEAFTSIVVMLLIVAIIILFCYFRIGWIVRKSGRNLRRHDKTQKPTAAANNNKIELKSISKGGESASPSSTIPKTATIAKSEKTATSSRSGTSPDMRILRISLVLFIVFVLSYVPIVLVRLAHLEIKSPTFYIFAYLTFSYSTCVNPLIYAVMSREYRAAYKNLFCNNKLKTKFFNSISTDTSNV